MTDQIKLVIVTPQATLFQNSVGFIQIPAYDGYMAFLPNHAPFVSTLGTGILSCGSVDDPSIRFAISGGYFEIHNNEMIVLADVAETPGMIDLDRANRARDRALSRINGDADGDWDLDRARAALVRAINRIHINELTIGH